MTRLSMPRPAPAIAGDLITLRPPDPVADAHDYYVMNLDPDMHTWTGNDILSTEADAQAELERLVSMEDVSTWMVVDNPSSRGVGRFFLCLEERGGIRIAGEGNRIAKSCWRKGHNREARRLLYKYAFSVLSVDRIETGAWAGNTNPIKSIESYGFQFEREEQEWNRKFSKRMSKRYYLLTKKEWEEIDGG